MSTGLILALIVEFFILMCMAMFEKNWGLAIYWVGAIVVNLGVIFMQK